MTLFKFLSGGAVGAFSGYPWPEPAGAGEPGGWTTAHAPFDPCRGGIHLCREVDLPYWILEELYVAEHAGQFVEDETFLLVRRARLMRRIVSWDREAGYRFSCSCAWRVRDRAADALRRAGRTAEADLLLGCTSMSDLVQSTKTVLTENLSQSARTVGYVADIILYADRTEADSGWAAAAATAAFIAASAAREMPGDSTPSAAADAERADQGRWIAALA